MSLDMLGKRIPEMEVRGEADLRSYKVDTLKARELLGSWLLFSFRCGKVNFREGGFWRDF